MIHLKKFLFFMHVTFINFFLCINYQGTSMGMLLIGRSTYWEILGAWTWFNGTTDLNWGYAVSCAICPVDIAHAETCRGHKGIFRVWNEAEDVKDLWTPQNKPRLSAKWIPYLVPGTLLREIGIVMLASLKRVQTIFRKKIKKNPRTSSHPRTLPAYKSSYSFFHIFSIFQWLNFG